MPRDSKPRPLLPVDDARARILEGLVPGDAERCALAEAMGRVVASDVASRLSLPPEAVSAMDGYAIRVADCQTVGATLTRIGESAAGRPWDGRLGPGQAVRIFTGAVVPDGADGIILQEDVEAGSETDGAVITVNEVPRDGQFIRPAGLDVTAGDIILTAGTVMSARLISLATSAGHTDISVWRRPHIGVLSTGDELVLPGDVPERGQIISSNATYLAAFIRACGAVPVDLGIARDRAGAMLEQVRAASLPLDMVVTTGGASVGTHDHLVSDLSSAGTELGFWKIAMRPGKPLLHGRIDGIPLLGLPGNPVSSAVCANIFLRPAIAQLSGSKHRPQMIAAELTEALRENDQRQDYLRSSLRYGEDGRARVTPARKQDSSMISIYANADALIVRPPFDAAKSAGDQVMVMRLDPLM
ncbi:MAG TPA: molybdopterin molybdenumtransferase MoeA [Alphaproteobacteria bacterium]|jgi:molybdopterin molybdotransferase|nr:molybdopterin molybdenumtransferase MoeA [Alphaproteobacteria bacterium]|tara:strand:- start:1163 stop:2407 length:1245 start_codon:yes stop_codon:yes gene_type:complete